MEQVKRKDISSTVMTNLTFNVNHDGCNVDVDYMVILYKNDKDGMWKKDTLDPCGMRNLTIPSLGVSISDSKEVEHFFDTLKQTTNKDFENQVNDLVEDTINTYTQSQWDDLVMSSLDLKICQCN